jgi:glycosyltransferase involved in cell wall biosynthesis
METPVTPPLISVIMSVYNGESFLCEAVESILNQSLADFEFIIIDDCSTDSTSSMLQRYARQDARIRLLCNISNIGLTKSLNRCLQECNGSFIARQDADDVSLPDRFIQQYRRFQSDQNLVLLGSAYHIIDAAGKVIKGEVPPLEDTAIRWQMLFHNSFAHSSVMIRREALVKYDLRYDEHHILAQDYGLWSKLLQCGKGANLAKPMILYRLHEGNIGGINHIQQQEAAAEIARKNLLTLGISLGDNEIGVLREWYNQCRITLKGNFLLPLELLFLIMERFGRLKSIDRQLFQQIQRTWMIRVLMTLSISRFFNCKYLSMLVKAFMFSPLYIVFTLLAFPVKALLRKPCDIITADEHDF